jgi:hypothetical protein
MGDQLMAATTTLTQLSDIRDQAAAALEPQGPDDPDVLVDVVDSLYPPVLMLLWDDPWLAPGSGAPSMGPCLWTARLQVLCVAGRLEPGPGIRTLEELVAYTVGHMKADLYTWPLEGVSAPRVFEIASIAYLGARVTYAVPITV